MLGREEGFGVEIPVEFAASTEVFEQFGSCFEGADEVGAGVDGVELGGPVGGATPAPEGSGLAVRRGGGAADGGWFCEGGVAGIW